MIEITTILPRFDLKHSDQPIMSRLVCGHQQFAAGHALRRSPTLYITNQQKIPESFRTLSRRGVIECPLRSPDLTPLEMSFGDRSKVIVYKISPGSLPNRQLTFSIIQLARTLQCK